MTQNKRGIGENLKLQFAAAGISLVLVLIVLAFYPAGDETARKSPAANTGTAVAERTSTATGTTVTTPPITNTSTATGTVAQTGTGTATGSGKPARLTITPVTGPTDFEIELNLFLALDRQLKLNEYYGAKKTCLKLLSILKKPADRNDIRQDLDKLNLIMRALKNWRNGDNSLALKLLWPLAAGNNDKWWESSAREEIENINRLEAELDAKWREANANITLKKYERARVILSEIISSRPGSATAGKAREILKKGFNAD